MPYKDTVVFNLFRLTYTMAVIVLTDVQNSVCYNSIHFAC